MSFPAHISKNLRRKLGEDVGGDLVTWLEEMRADHARLVAEIRASEERIASRMDERFARVDERLAGLQVAIADTKADLMKWMLVCWVGAVGAIAALAGVLRP